MKTLIVTLNYKQVEYITRLAESMVKNLPEQGWHWIIRDNTPDESVELAMKKYSDPRITLLRRENTGTFASQHNELMKEGLFEGYDNICLLNNDTVAVHDFLTPMVETIKDKTVGVVGARLFYPNKQLQHCGIAISSSSMPFNISSHSASQLKIHEGVHMRSRKYIAVTGACLLIGKADYEQLGGMKDDYPWCFDDVDLCFRVIKELKKKCIGCANANLIHYENTTTLKNPSELKPSFPVAMKMLKEAHADMLDSNWEIYKMDANIYE